MLSQEIRRRFLNYFKEQGHTIVPSSSVVPHDDPTLLFTNAGMNQFKDIFLGKTEGEYKRAVSSQKCIRVGGKHNDLDNVGHTARHLTFFEMLGNFSFGDYFKQEAISFAWEVAIQVFGFEPEKIWVTVFREDDEAFEYWKKIVPEKRIVRMDEKDNFWEMGETGPCGPCSELYYDKGPKYGSAASIKEDVSGERYLEFWNLVFMQFNRSSSGQCTPLPRQSIDTGSGLERVVSLKMGVDTLFGTDIFQGLIAEIENISHQKYDPTDPILAPAYHVIADHIRSLAFAMADGAQPSNIERGYILRKLLRRAVRYGRMLGLYEPFLAKLLPRLIALMGPDYPSLKTANARMTEILTIEEEGFLRTLKKGGNILSQIIDKAKLHPHKQITGEEAFKLKDTYGFPIEEVLLIAKDTGLQVNLEAYQLLEEKAKELSRSAHTSHAQQVEENLFADYVKKHGTTEFIGYTHLSSESTIMGLMHEGQFVDKLEENQEGLIFLNQTPFYAEKGGQVADHGELSHQKALFEVTQCQSPYSGVIAHIGKMKKGTFILGEPIVASIDPKRRQKIANHHTATHLLHWALEKVLGEHIRQAGSLVEEDRLRFDFNHHKPVSKEEIREIELLVNQKIREGKEVKSYELSLEEVQGKSDIKQFFGEKYGSKVRVIDLDDSKELCGGTHTHNTSTIGYFRITKETSIASGVRRIEALSAQAAERFAYQSEDLLEQAASLFKISSHQLIERIGKLQDEHKALGLALKELKQKELHTLSLELAEQAKQIGPLSFLSAIVCVDVDLLPDLMEQLIIRLTSAVVILATKQDHRCQLMVRISSDLTKKGLQAVDLIKEIAPLCGGAGGGKKEIAQAGGKNPEGIVLAFEKAEEWLLKNI